MGKRLMGIQGIDKALVVQLIREASQSDGEDLLDKVLVVAHSAGVIKGGQDAFARADALLASFIKLKG